MRTIRVSLAGTVALALVAALSVAVTAQSDEATSIPAPAVLVTGSDSCHLSMPGTFAIEPGGISREHDIVMDCTHTANDPRFAGEFITTYNEDCYLTTAGTVECLYHGTDTTETSECGWDCILTGSQDPTETNYALLLTVCSGTGGYEGLAYVGRRALGSGVAGDFGDDSSHRGLIYEGGPPAQ